METVRVYTVDEASAILGIKRAKLYALVAEGKLRAVKLDGVAGMRIRERDLDAYLKRATVVAPKEVDDGLPARSRSRATA